MITENLSTLKIHKLTQAQYDRELEAGRLDENALYLTPDEEIDLSGYASASDVEALKAKVGDTSVSEQVETAISSSYTELDNNKADTIQHKTGNVITVNNSSHTPVRGLKLFGKTIQNGTPTPETPVPLESVGADGNVAVTVCGKNLLDISSYPLTPGGYINYLVGNYVIDGDTSLKATADFIPVEHLQGITISMNFRASYSVPGIAFYTEAVNTGAYISGCKPGVVTVPDNACFMRITADSVYEDLQIEIGSNSTEYEPCKESQAITAQTPNGLLGIPVSSGGNYTDENGQMWICDEIDFASGKYVQKIGKIDSYADETISGAYMSTTGELSMGATVLYALSKPIETDLTAEEIAQYSDLHTNEGYTTVYNDSNASMELTYYTPTTAVQMVHSPADEGKLLGIDKHGCVVLTDSAIPENLAYISDEDQEGATATINADTLGGRPANEYVLKSEIGDIDISGSGGGISSSEVDTKIDAKIEAAIGAAIAASY